MTQPMWCSPTHGYPRCVTQTGPRCKPSWTYRQCSSSTPAFHQICKENGAWYSATLFTETAFHSWPRSWKGGGQRFWCCMIGKDMFLGASLVSRGTSAPSFMVRLMRKSEFWAFNLIIYHSTACCTFFFFGGGEEGEVLRSALSDQILFCHMTDLHGQKTAQSDSC